MKHLRSFFLCLCAVLLLFGGTAAAASVPEPDSELLYVTDLANLLSTETENEIAARNDILYAATGAQFAVLTIETLPAGYDSESYCYEVFNAWGVGSAEDNGVLLLLVPNEGKFWMVSGAGLQSVLSGGVLSELLDVHLAEDFDAGRYDAGVMALFDAVWDELETLYGDIDASQTDAPAPEAGYAPGSSSTGGEGNAHALAEGVVNFVVAVLTIVAVLFVLCMVIYVLHLIQNASSSLSHEKKTPPPPVGNPPYYRVYIPRLPRRPPGYRPPHHPPSNHRPPSGGFGSGHPSGGFGSGHPMGGFSSSRPSNRPSGGFSSGRPSGGFGGGRPSGSRSFGGGRSHGGGGGRR